MEIPYAGRAIITDNFNGLEITIPTKKNWFIIVFLGFWLCMWVGGETIGLGVGTGLFEDEKAPALFMLLWLGGWTVGGYFALRTFFWNLTGKEIVEAGQGTITIEKKGILVFAKAKTYDLNEAKHFRVQEDYNGFNNFGGLGGFGNRRNVFSLDSGTIRFDYGMDTVKFGGGLSEAEARSIINRLSDKKILSDKNFLKDSN